MAAAPAGEGLSFVWLTPFTIKSGGWSCHRTRPLHTVLALNLERQKRSSGSVFRRKAKALTSGYPY
ncbi:hypothetical protein KCP75_10955 [Salmonella enterica subsp. enterica]|nr:hypothetical protein KCP75_10955 [Salmonella enterica subsp. enterica]